MLGAVGFWFCSFLFGGIFLKPERIIWPFRAFTYVSPLRWSLGTMHYLAFRGTSWEGGFTGEQMLDSISEQFNVEGVDHVLEDILYTLLIGVSFKACSFCMIMLKTRAKMRVLP